MVGEESDAGVKWGVRGWVGLIQLSRRGLQEFLSVLSPVTVNSTVTQLKERCHLRL